MGKKRSLSKLSINILMGGMGIAFILILSEQCIAQIPFQNGWPVEVDGYYSSPIYIADVDNDSEVEIIISDAQPGGSSMVAKLYVYKSDGSLKSGWPVEEISSYNAPSLVDLDDDGTLEIISIYAGIHVYAYDGTLVWEHPYSGSIFQNTYAPRHVSIDDLDNDGVHEIVVTCGSGGAVFVFDTEGNVKPGWPQAAGNSIVSATIGDIDNDGLKEIIVSTSQIYCFKPDGQQCSGFPFVSDRAGKSKPIVIDFNNDSYQEIIFATEDVHWGIYAIDHTGTLISPYPLDYLTMRQASVGDLNRDGNFELIYGWLSLRGYDLATASQVPNFPFTDPDGLFGFSDKSPILADLSDDPGIEVASGAYNGAMVWDGKLFAFNQNGQVVNGFPSELLYHRGLSRGCTVNDLDGDGDIEICCGSENMEFIVPRSSTVYCWDIDHPYNLDNIDWAMDGFDLGHTGRWRKLYHIDKVGSTLSVMGCATDPCYLPADGALHTVSVTALRAHAPESPSGQDVRYSRTLGCGEYSGPVIDHGDGTYTRTLQAPSIECSTEVHAWVNEFKLNDSATIYFTHCNDPANLGDVDLDGDIDYTDRLLVQNFVDGLIDLSGPEFCRGDVNRDMAATDVDIALLNNCIRARCDQLPEPFKTSCRNHGNCYLGDAPRGFPYDHLDRDLPSIP